MPRRPLHLIWAATLVAASGTARSVWAQEATPEAATQQPTAELSVRFAFKDASVEQVIDFFARQTGLPVIRESDLPGGTITFVSDDAYPLDEALRVLNTILQTRGVMLRRDARFLYLQKLENMKAEAVPTFTGPGIPAGVTDDQVVSVVVRLRNAQAKPVAEQLAPLVASYGAIVAMPQQNSIVLTETAAQARRITAIIESLDSKPAFEESVKLFPLKHVRARDALASLRVLVAEKKTTVVLDADGKRRTIAEDDLGGLRIEADARTNSIIAVGAEGRLATIESLVRLLDVDAAEAGGGERPVRVITLRNADANSVAGSAGRMFEQSVGPAELRPSIAVDGASNSLVVRGSAAQLAEIESLASTLDGVTAAASRELRTVAIDRSRADAREVAETVRRLLQNESGVRVRVISAEELLGTSAPTGGGGAAPAKDEKPEESGGEVGPPAFIEEVRNPVLLPPRIKLIIEYTQVLLAALPQDEASEDGEVTIAVDPETNALIIMGPRRAAARAVELAERVQRELPGQMGKVTVVELPDGVPAWTVASSINQSLWAIGPASKDNPGGLTGGSDQAGDGPASGADHQA
jgi:type II secretory pathway component GspD/PulD (secretin)